MVPSTKLWSALGVTLDLQLHLMHGSDYLSFCGLTQDSAYPCRQSSVPLVWYAIVLLLHSHFLVPEQPQNR